MLGFGWPLPRRPGSRCERLCVVGCTDLISRSLPTLSPVEKIDIAQQGIPSDPCTAQPCLNIYISVGASLRLSLYYFLTRLGPYLLKLNAYPSLTLGPRRLWGKEVKLNPRTRLSHSSLLVRVTPQYRIADFSAVPQVTTTFGCSAPSALPGLDLMRAHPRRVRANSFSLAPADEPSQGSHPVPNLEDGDAIHAQLRSILYPHLVPSFVPGVESVPPAAVSPVGSGSVRVTRIQPSK